MPDLIPGAVANSGSSTDRCGRRAPGCERRSRIKNYPVHGGQEAVFRIVRERPSETLSDSSLTMLFVFIYHRVRVCVPITE